MSKKIINSQQLHVLETYYNKNNRLPRRKEKLEIANQLNLSGIIINKWFQAKRNKEKYLEKKKIF